MVLYGWNIGHIYVLIIKGGEFDQVENGKMITNFENAPMLLRLYSVDKGNFVIIFKVINQT